MTERAELLRDRLLQRYPESELERVTLRPDAFARGLPPDYLEFLEGVGSGTIGDGRYTFYGGPLDPDEVFDSASAADLHDVILVGDNFGGDPLAYVFRAGTWVLIEIDHTAPSRWEPGRWTDIFAFVDSVLLRQR